jgi:hypothetical protein
MKKALLLATLALTSASAYAQDPATYEKPSAFIVDLRNSEPLALGLLAGVAAADDKICTTGTSTYGTDAHIVADGIARVIAQHPELDKSLSPYTLAKIIQVHLEETYPCKTN